MPGAPAGGEPSLFDTTSTGSSEAPGTTAAAVTIPAVVGSTVGIAPLPEELSMSVGGDVSMSMPSDAGLSEDVAVTEVMFESLSIPAIYEAIHGSSMSIPEGWTPEAEGYVASETGGYVEPESDDVTSGSDDPTGTNDTTEEEPESDDVESGDREVSSAAGSILSGAVSAACLAGALALF